MHRLPSQWFTRFLNCPLIAASSRPSARPCVTGRPAGSHTTTPPSVEKKTPRVALISRFLAVQWGPPAHRSHLCAPADKAILNHTALLNLLSFPTPPRSHALRPRLLQVHINQAYEAPDAPVALQS